MNREFEVVIGRTRVVLEIGELPGGVVDALWRRYAAFATPAVGLWAPAGNVMLPGSGPRDSGAALQTIAAGVPVARGALPCDSGAPDLARIPYRVRVRYRPGTHFLAWRPGAALPLRTRRIGDRVVCVTPDVAGVVDLVRRTGAVTVCAAGSLENYLRVLVGWDVVQRQGLLLHAAGIVHADRACVFFGASGAGKSTVAGLSAPRPVLSDDLVLIERSGAGYVACGAPFRGSEWQAPRLNACAPLAALFALEQAPHHARQPLATAAAVARLVAATPFVTTCRRGVTRVVEAALGLATTIAPARLQFRKDGQFWEVIDG